MNISIKNTRLVKGIITLLIGALLLIYPGLTVVTIIKFLGFLLIISGAIILVPQLMNRKNSNRFWTTESIINIVLGLIFVSFPEQLASIFIAIFGILAFIIGIIKLMAYSKFRKSYVNPILMLLESAYYIVIGILIFANPFESVQVIVRLIGLFLLIYGIMDILNLNKKSGENEYEVIG
jgi:uncharacterized membrane protein HdeD (DUF308 family)